MLVYAATTNAGKLAELRTLFASAGWRIQAPSVYRAVLEGETSYAVNAALKAAALRLQLAEVGVAAATLGDDSGLEVGALGGRPGVLSARYGGAEATWSQRRRQLLSELSESDSADRSARFVCALHYIDAGGRHFSAECDVWGSIARVATGYVGFSYDPIFFYEPLGKTFGELGEAEKNRVSHRALAVSALIRRVSAARQGQPEMERGKVLGRNGM